MATIARTQSPNVYTDEIGCGDTLRAYIGVNDEKVYYLIINQNTTQVLNIFMQWIYLIPHKNDTGRCW